MKERIRQRDLVRQQLVVNLDDLISNIATIRETIKKGENPGLGGALQNVWDVFYKIGELNILDADYLFESEAEIERLQKYVTQLTQRLEDNFSGAENS